MLGTVEAIWRYPVKSMLGEELEAASAGERGLAGDRARAVVDLASGRIASAKQPRLWERLLACQAAVIAPGIPGTAPVVRITLPDGRRLAADEDGADSALSALLDRPVRLASNAPASAEIERYWPDVEGMPQRDTYSTGPIAAAAAGTFFDYAPIHLLTTAGLDHVQSLYPAGRFAARRFRPNLVIRPAAGAGAFPENDWVGRILLIGDRVRLRVIDPSPRCVIPTLAQGDLPRDLGILRAVAAHNRMPVPALDGAVMPCLGVYALVEQGGTVHRGAAVLDGGPAPC